MLIVRGRCFSTHKFCFRANRVLENLLWNWSKMRRPYVVYRGGNDGTGDCDLVPAWLTHECVYKGFCQCNLVGPRYNDWHHLGALYSNIVSRRHQLFEGRRGCSHVGSLLWRGLVPLWVRAAGRLLRGRAAQVAAAFAAHVCG